MRALARSVARTRAHGSRQLGRREFLKKEFFGKRKVRESLFPLSGQTEGFFVRSFSILRGKGLNTLSLYQARQAITPG